MKKYACCLDEQNAAVSVNHSRSLAVRSSASDYEKLELLSAVQFVKPEKQAQFVSLVEALRSAEYYCPVFVNDHEPRNIPSRKAYCQQLRSSLPFQVVLLTYLTGNNLGDYLHAWRIPSDEVMTTTTMKNHSVISDIESKLPIYHTRQMRKDFQEHVGRLCNVQPAVIRWMYCFLTGDSCAAVSARQADVDRRVLLAIDAEDDSLCGVFAS